MQFTESVNSVKNKNLITKFFMSGNIDKIIDFYYYTDIPVFVWVIRFNYVIMRWLAANTFYLKLLNTDGFVIELYE